MKVYVNGQMVDKDKAVISAFDRGFLYGDGVFETMRSYGGKIFRIKDHLNRLSASMKFLRIRQPLADKEIEKVVYELLESNCLKDARIRATVSRGSSEDGKMDISKSRPSNIVIITEEYILPPDKYYEKGVAADIARSRRNSQSVLSRLKVLNYLESILARNEAIPKGCFDTIFLNDAGHVSEGGTCNIFMVSGNKLLTPSPDCGILPGITRKVILEISRYAGVGIQEGKFTEDELKSSSEVFITNSLFEVMPVVKVENKTIGAGTVGEVTKKIQSLYKEEVRKETEG
ncbi:MAG: aminotransferase class IV [Candidatus Omnitrophica bacterium]|nr:aminotransferase class IV [Candidatus Omnitrophota bacterium]